MTSHLKEGLFDDSLVKTNFFSSWIINFKLSNVESLKKLTFKSRNTALFSY